MSLAGAAREIVFGLEDSLVSTLGATAGVAVGSGDRYVVILAGLVLVVVEAISMAAGSYLSTKSAEEIGKERARQDASRMLQERVSDDESLADMLRRKRFTAGEVATVLEALGRERKIWLKEILRAEHRRYGGTSGNPLLAALVMGVVYVLGGVAVFVPYMVIASLGTAIAVSVVIAVCALFVLGVWKARMANIPVVRSGMEMVVVSCVAAALGIVVGRLASVTLGV